VNVSKCWRELIISQREFAKIVGLTQQRVSQMCRDEELVCDDEGKILLTQSLVFLHRQAAEKKGDAEVSYDEEKALHEKAKREIAELKLGELKNELHKTSDITYLVGNMVVVFRRTLLALPSKMATSLAGKTPEDINELLTKEINRALKELSEFDASKLENLDAGDDNDG
jgi:phage terminase Nu1 subunit (DNA packaging protein)